MEKALFHSHSGLRYIIFLLLIMVLVKAVMNLLSKKEWAKSDSKLSMFLMAATHLQVVMGLVMYFFVYQYYQLMSNMSDSLSRWKAVEHLTAMLVFVVLVSVLHIGNKKENKLNRNRRALILGLIALLVGLAGIPFDRWF